MGGAEFGKGDLAEESLQAGEREEGRICQDCRRKGMLALTEREEEKKRENEESMMLNLNLPSTPTLVQGNPPRWQTATSEENWGSPEDRIVKNLQFSLEQLRVVGDEASYMDLVEKLVVGPAPLRASHMEQMLGINPDLVSRATSTSKTRTGKREKNGKGAESEYLDLKEVRSRRIRATRVDLLE